MKQILIYTSLFLFIGISGCDKESKVDEENRAEILDYISDNNLDAQETDSGLFYVIEKEGDGDFPTLSDDVTVHYEGFYTDDSKFDSSIDRGMPSTFPLTGVIQGWQEGIPLFSRGGYGKLLIPASLGYGYNSTNGIPGGSVLVFDVELIDF